MTLFQQIKQCCEEDANLVVEHLNRITGKQFNIGSIQYLCDAVQLEQTEEEVECPVQVKLTDGQYTISLMWSYSTLDDDLYLDTEIRTIVHRGVAQYNKAAKVYSATAITAAEDDMDMIDDDFMYEDGSIKDGIDELSDKVEDIQDQVDDMDEDNIDINMDNNITNHYIAECESCHGIFISAMIESDQAVEKITGVCPLCEKDTDQYIKWVVKDVDRK